MTIFTNYGYYGHYSLVSCVKYYCRLMMIVCRLSLKKGLWPYHLTLIIMLLFPKANIIMKPVALNQDPSHEEGQGQPQLQVQVDRKRKALGWAQRPEVKDCWLVSGGQMSNKIHDLCRSWLLEVVVVWLKVMKDKLIIFPHLYSVCL